MLRANVFILPAKRGGGEKKKQALNTLWGKKKKQPLVVTGVDVPCGARPLCLD